MTHVWYLAHPIATDELYTVQQNMDHVLHMMRICIHEGFHVVAPYHTILLVLDEHNIEHRKLGLEISIETARVINKVIFVGHKMSTGMQKEFNALRENGGMMINLVGMNDAHVRIGLKNYMHYFNELSLSHG